MRAEVKVRKFKMQTKYPHQRSEGTRGKRGLPPPEKGEWCDKNHLYEDCRPD